MAIEELIKSIISKMEEMKSRYILFQSKWQDFMIYTLIKFEDTPRVYIRIPKDNPYFEKQDFDFGPNIVLSYTGYKLPWKEEEKEENWYWGFTPMHGTPDKNFFEEIQLLLIRVKEQSLPASWEIKEVKSFAEALAKKAIEEKHATQKEHRKLHEIKEREVSKPIEIELSELIEFSPYFNFIILLSSALQK
jgi:hypothetical protein